jgi:hypothetical protein
MFDTHVIPRWCKGHYEVGEGRDGENRKHRALAEAHDQRADGEVRRLEMQSVRTGTLRSENLNRESFYCAPHNQMEIGIGGVFTGGNPRRSND